MQKELQSQLRKRLCSLKFIDLVVPECVKHTTGALLGREMRSFPEEGSLTQGPKDE